MFNRHYSIPQTHCPSNSLCCRRDSGLQLNAVTYRLSDITALASSDNEPMLDMYLCIQTWIHFSPGRMQTSIKAIPTISNYTYMKVKGSKKTLANETHLLHFLQYLVGCNITPLGMGLQRLSSSSSLHEGSFSLRCSPLTLFRICLNPSSFS